MKPDDLFSNVAAANFVGVSQQALAGRRRATGYQRVVVSGKRFYERSWLEEYRMERRRRAEEILDPKNEHPTTKAYRAIEAQAEEA